MLIAVERSHTLTVGHIYYSSYKDIISNSSLTRAANGAELNRADYPELFAKIGTTFGEGDGSTTFNLPNLIHKFPEGGYHSQLGTVHDAGLPNITGNLGWHGAGGTTPYTNLQIVDGCFQSHGQIDGRYGTTTQVNKSYSQGGAFFNASRSSSIYGNSNTVQPASLELNPVIVVRSNVYVAYCFRRTS